MGLPRPTTFAAPAAFPVTGGTNARWRPFSAGNGYEAVSDTIRTVSENASSDTKGVFKRGSASGTAQSASALVTVAARHPNGSSAGRAQPSRG